MLRSILKFKILIFLSLSSCSTLKTALMNSPTVQELEKYLDVQGKIDESKKYQNSDISAVINGEEVLLEDPLRDSVVLITIVKDQKTSVCTGALINKKTVLTAAHCVHGSSSKNLKAILLDRSVEKKESKDIDKVYVHPDYDGTTQSFSDLAILTLKEPLKRERLYLSLVKDISAVTSDEVILAGYGVTDESLRDSMTLRKVKKSFKHEIYIREKLIGVGQKAQSGGFCRGDSGAPIIVKSNNVSKVIGINSFTVELEEGKECHSASVAVSIPQNIKWIHQKTNSNL